MYYSVIKYLKGHLPCASMIRSVIKIDSRADGVFIASVAVFVQKFIHNSRNPIFAELRQIFLDLCVSYSRFVTVPLKRRGKKFLTCPAVRLEAVGVRQIRAQITISGIESNKKEDWKLPVHQERSNAREAKIMLFHLFALRKIIPRLFDISFYRTDCDVGGRTEAVGWIKTVLAAK